MIFFRDAHRLSTKKSMRSDIRQAAELFQMGAEMHLLQEEREKHLN